MKASFIIHYLYHSFSKIRLKSISLNPSRKVLVSYSTLLSNSPNTMTAITTFNIKSSLLWLNRIQFSLFTTVEGPYRILSLEYSYISLPLGKRFEEKKNWHRTLALNVSFVTRTSTPPNYQLQLVSSYVC